MRRVLLICERSLVRLVFGVLLTQQILVRLIGTKSAETANAAGNAVLADKTSIGSMFRLEFISTSNITTSEIVSDFSITIGIVLIGLFWSAIISLVIGYAQSREPHRRTWDGLNAAGTIVSAVPILVGGLVAWSFLFHFCGGEPIEALGIIPLVMVGGVLLGSLEGTLLESTRGFRIALAGLQHRTYFLARQARGQDMTRLVLRSAQDHFLKNLPTRISYLFGGAIIVEKALGVFGLGGNFLQILHGGATINVENYSKAMVYGLVLMVSVVGSRMLAELMVQYRSLE